MTTLAPMLATTGTSVPVGDEWVFEPKYDGIRILASATGREIALITRNGLDKSRQFPEIVDALRALRRRVNRAFILDGEIVAMREQAPARFQELQGRIHVRDETAIEAHRADAPAALFAFDMLLDGPTSLITESWRVRRKHLAALFRPPVRSDALRL